MGWVLVGLGLRPIDGSWLGRTLGLEEWEDLAASRRERRDCIMGWRFWEF